MRLYLDSSLVVAALIHEPHSERVQEWLALQEPGAMAISLWVVTEVSSALSLKRRTGEIDEVLRSGAAARFEKVVAPSLDLLPVVAAHFRQAAAFAARWSLSLRSGDALHLAIASDHGAGLCTLDKRLAEAGPQLAVETLLV